MGSMKCPNTKDFVPVCDELEGFNYRELYLPVRTCMAILNKSNDTVKYQAFDSNDSNPFGTRQIECNSKLFISSLYSH